jgi:deoxyribose-phosphate aldolase
MDCLTLAQHIDSTLLRPGISSNDIELLCRQAQQYQFRAVCVAPTWVRYADELLSDSCVRVCSVIGFPSGMHHTRLKITEAREALNDGADELDLVLNRSLSTQEQKWEVEAVRDMCHNRKTYDGFPRVIKIIVESSACQLDELKSLCELMDELGVDFVKTSTGVYGNAQEDDINVMNKYATKIKASGGIADFGKCLKLLNMPGVERIGTSHARMIIEEGKQLTKLGITSLYQ